MNTTDANPHEAVTRLLFDDQPTTLALPVRGAELQLAEPGVCPITLEPEQGRIHCHDVPFANFGATGDSSG